MFKKGCNSSQQRLKIYIILRPILRKVLPTNGSAFISDLNKSCIAECIKVLAKVRKASRGLASYMRVNASQTPCFVHGLCHTFDLLSDNQNRHMTVLEFIESLVQTN